MSETLSEDVIELWTVFSSIALSAMNTEAGDDYFSVTEKSIASPEGIQDLLDNPELLAEMSAASLSNTTSKNLQSELNQIIQAAEQASETAKSAVASGFSALYAAMAKRLIDFGQQQRLTRSARRSESKLERSALSQGKAFDEAVISMLSVFCGIANVAKVTMAADEYRDRTGFSIASEHGLHDLMSSTALFDAMTGAISDFGVFSTSIDAARKIITPADRVDWSQVARRGSFVNLRAGAEAGGKKQMLARRRLAMA